MNKNKLIKIVLILTLVFNIIGCKKKPAPENNKNGEAVITVSYADDDFFKKYKSYDSFIENEEYAHKIAIIPNVPVEDFSWLSISFDFDKFDKSYEVVWEIDDELYTLKELDPQKPLVVSWVEVGMMSAFGFSYRDKDGQKKYFIGLVGNYGDDPEEYDGPDFEIGEFFPIKNVIGKYEYTDDENNLLLYLEDHSYKLNINNTGYEGTAVIDYGKVDTNVVDYGKCYWFVTLDGVKWAHNWVGNFADGNYDNIDWEKLTDIETYGLYLWLEENENGKEFVFQNHGDPMAPYVIFEELGDKFVSLKKAP